MKKLIAYYRTSTNDQHLGISAQKEIVRKYCEFNNSEIISEYEEHESGKKNNRPQLTKALAETVRIDAYLIVAKIDRLTRVAYYGLQLCERFKIIFCDHPEMGTLEQSIYFGLAQQEREFISLRTKAALQVLIRRGIKLGAPNPRFSDEMRTLALEKRRNNSRLSEANRRAYAVVSVLPGTYTYKANFLNSNGFLTNKGGRWRANQVKRLMELYTISVDETEVKPEL